MDTLVQEFGHATFWVAIALFIFIGGTIYFGVHKRVGTMLDGRRDAIRDELDEARSLREEAQTLLASYQRKHLEAEKEAEELVAQARRDAENMAREAEETLAAQVKRRTVMAEQKIATAETQAVNEVRAVAADVAIAAASKIIAEKVDATKSDSLIRESIDGLKDKVH